MSDVSRARHIARPVDEVWAALADFGAIARWAADVDHSCLRTDQQGGVGTARRVQVGRLALVERVSTWDTGPPHTLAYDIEGLPAALGAVSNCWVLERVGSGTTVTVTAGVEGGPRPPLKVAARVGAARLAKANDAMLQGLDDYLAERTTVRTEATA